MWLPTKDSKRKFWFQFQVAVLTNMFFSRCTQDLGELQSDAEAKGSWYPWEQYQQKNKSTICFCFGGFFPLSSRVAQLLDRFIDGMYDYFSRNGREPWISTPSSFPITPHRAPDLSAMPWGMCQTKTEQCPAHRYSFPHSATGKSINLLPICTEVFVCSECAKLHCHSHHLPLRQGTEMQLLFLPFHFGLQPFLVNFMQHNVNYC